MMNSLRAETEKFLDELESLARKKFVHRQEIGLLLDTASSPEKIAAMNELAFLSKFVSQSAVLLRREGISPNDLTNLTKEFSENLQRASGFLRSVLASASPDVIAALANKFLGQTPECLENFLSLMNELSWLKNYEIDNRKISNAR